MQSSKASAELGSEGKLASLLEVGRTFLSADWSSLSKTKKILLLALITLLLAALLSLGWHLRTAQVSEQNEKLAQARQARKLKLLQAPVAPPSIILFPAVEIQNNGRKLDWKPFSMEAQESPNG